VFSKLNESEMQLDAAVLNRSIKFLSKSKAKEVFFIPEKLQKTQIKIINFQFPLYKNMDQGGRLQYALGYVTRAAQMQISAAIDCSSYDQRRNSRPRILCPHLNSTYNELGCLKRLSRTIVGTHFAPFFKSTHILSTGHSVRLNIYTFPRRASLACFSSMVNPYDESVSCVIYKGINEVFSHGRTAERVSCVLSFCLSSRVHSLVRSFVQQRSNPFLFLIEKGACRGEV
jgi:hypothetical protein